MNKTATLSFKYDYPEEETVSLSFNYDGDGTTIAEYHDYCKRFAATMGYTDATIEKMFGESVYDY